LKHRAREENPWTLPAEAREHEKAESIRVPPKDAYNPVTWKPKGIIAKIIERRMELVIVSPCFSYLPYFIFLASRLSAHKTLHRAA